MKKLNEKMLSGYLKIKNRLSGILKEEKGAAEIVAILFIIIILVAVVIVFRDQLQTLIENIFSKIDTESKDLMTP